MEDRYHNRLTEMETFTYVVESGNFSEAARRLNMAPSSISKLIARLEMRLSARLMNRTTRKIILTEEGKLYYHHAMRIISEIKETEASLSSQQTSQRGKVRITCSVPFALHQLIPLLPEFNKTHPDIELILLSSDTVIDILGERCDIAIRIGKLQDSTLKVRKLAESKMILVASPSYLKEHGKPKHPSQLNKFQCLNFYAHPSLNDWPFDEIGTQKKFHAKSSFSADNGESIRKMVLSDGGIARLSAFMVRADIQQGKLIPLLENKNPGDLQSIFLLHASNIPTRVKIVINFIFEKLGGTCFK